MYLVSVCFYKKALIVAILIRDNIAELKYYERLSVLMMNLGDTKRLQAYHDRAFYSLTEPTTSTAFELAQARESTKKRN
jgi:hypothetical protein